MVRSRLLVASERCKGGVHATSYKIFSNLNFKYNLLLFYGCLNTLARAKEWESIELDENIVKYFIARCRRHSCFHSLPHTLCTPTHRTAINIKRFYFYCVSICLFPFHASYYYDRPGKRNKIRLSSDSLLTPSPTLPALFPLFYLNFYFVPFVVVNVRVYRVYSVCVYELLCRRSGRCLFIFYEIFTYLHNNYLSVGRRCRTYSHISLCTSLYYRAELFHYNFLIIRKATSTKQKRVEIVDSGKKLLRTTDEKF